MHSKRKIQDAWAIFDLEYFPNGRKVVDLWQQGFKEKEALLQSMYGPLRSIVEITPVPLLNRFV